MKASQRNNTNHTCHNLPTSLEQVALTVVSQPQKYIVGDGEELKHLVLARKVMESRHLHLPTFNALSLKRIEALEQNIAIEKQDPGPSRTSIPMDQPSAEPSIAAPADTSFSKSRQYRFALTCAFITKSPMSQYACSAPFLCSSTRTRSSTRCWNNSNLPVKPASASPFPRTLFARAGFPTLRVIG